MLKIIKSLISPSETAPEGPAAEDRIVVATCVLLLEMARTDGEFHDVQLVVNDWQQSDLAFLDLEDGTGTCMNGTTLVNEVVRGIVPSRDFHALEFTLGVPFAKNHGDPLLAKAPLGDADMHWHWRGGYKFLRAGLKSDSDSFWLHLGSTGCEGTIRNITGCNAPNRVAVRIENYQLGAPVQVDLARLVANGVLDDASPSDCSSGPSEADCTTAFSALGRSHPSGSVNSDQKLFSSRSNP